MTSERTSSAADRGSVPWAPALLAAVLLTAIGAASCRGERLDSSAVDIDVRGAHGGGYCPAADLAGEDLPPPIMPPRRRTHAAANSSPAAPRPTAVPAAPAQRPPPEAPIVRGPRAPHDVHAEMDMECSDCHEPDEKTGEPAMPDHGVCWDCHEDIEEDAEPEQKLMGVLFDAQKQPLWRRAYVKNSSDVRFDHMTHAAAEVACIACHGTMATTAEGRRARPVRSMDECMDCHAESKAANDCATCHEQVGRKTRPPSHEHVGAWRSRHGRVALTERRLATQNRCDLCHVEPSDCTSCHLRTKPASHTAPWRFDHGERVATLGGVLPARCEMCHTSQDFCVSCHRTTQPRSHQLGWRTRHGARVQSAGVAFPARCEMCHESRAACDRCHQETRPASHNRAWQATHGQSVARLGGGTPSRCSMCHIEDRYCADCHARTPPASHARLWPRRHGRLVRAAGGALPASCTLCHTSRTFCDRCHLDEPPRSHTTLFRTRTHGVLVSIDRRSCRTCHQVDFCIRCHQDTEPRSHRGGWAAGRNTHCVQCHFPVGRNRGCSTCHKEQPVHATAPPQPANHSPGRDCRVCHNALGRGGAPRMRHVDRGLACEGCHR